MNNINNSQLENVTSPISSEVNTSSNATNVRGVVGGAFSGELNEPRSRGCCTLLSHRIVKSDSVECKQSAEGVQRINYLEEVSAEMKKENWEALSELLNKVINSGMSHEELTSIIKKIQEFEIKSEQLRYELGQVRYELGNNLNEVFEFAVDNNQIDLVKILLEIAFSANDGDMCDIKHDSLNEPRIPMSYAAEYGHVKIADLLLSRGAEINPCGICLLRIATVNSNVDMVRLLLIRGS